VSISFILCIALSWCVLRSWFVLFVMLVCYNVLWLVIVIGASVALCIALFFLFPSRGVLKILSPNGSCLTSPMILYSFLESVLTLIAHSVVSMKEFIQCHSSFVHCLNELLPK
jgi:hypothetical protein